MNSGWFPLFEKIRYVTCVALSSHNVVLSCHSRKQELQPEALQKCLTLPKEETANLWHLCSNLISSKPDWTTQTLLWAGAWPATKHARTVLSQATWSSAEHLQKSQIVIVTVCNCFFTKERVTAVSLGICIQVTNILISELQSNKPHPNSPKSVFVSFHQGTIVLKSFPNLWPTGSSEHNAVAVWTSFVNRMQNLGYWQKKSFCTVGT